MSRVQLLRLEALTRCALEAMLKGVAAAIERTVAACLKSSDYKEGQTASMEMGRGFNGARLAAVSCRLSFFASAAVLVLRPRPDEAVE